MHPAGKAASVTTEAYLLRSTSRALRIALHSEWVLHGDFTRTVNEADSEWEENGLRLMLEDHHVSRP